MITILLLAAVITNAQDPVVAFPKNYSLALENSEVAVVRVHYGPHEKIGVHDHSKTPTVYVYLSDSGPVRFQHFEDADFTLTRPRTVKGAFRVSPGRLERHSVENIGDVSSDFLRVELKQISLGNAELHFKEKARIDLSETRTSVEFKTPLLEIERVVCREAAGCAVGASAGPSLVVTFTPSSITMVGAGKTAERLPAGGVLWEPASQAITVKPNGEPAAHLLRIVLLWAHC